MAIAQRQPGQARFRSVGKSRGRGWRAAMPTLAAVAVLVVGLGLTITLSVVTAKGHNRTNAKLLALQTRLISGAIASSEPLYVEDHLGGAASLAAATDGSTAAFRQGLADAVSARGQFVTASLWRLAGASAPALVTQVGSAPALAPGSATALLRRAAASKTFVVTKLAAGRGGRIGYAIAASGPAGRYVAYAEEPLPASRSGLPASSPVSDLNIAVYLGRAQTRAALLDSDSAAPLPLRGTTYTTRIPFGDTVLTLTASARSSLTGSLGVVLPWAIAIGGALITILAALLVERLVRRRDSAERLTGEIGRLYVEQRSVAETLQHAILPQRLPAVPGMQIAVRYLPGAGGADVGGDWYDVVPLDDARFVFVVGDVSGRGVRAAAMMASLHYASRAYALEGHPPTVILDQLTRTMDLAKDGHFATVLCGLVDVGTHEVTLANAGHLPPLVCGDGRASLVPAKPGSPIGIPGLAPFEPATVITAAGGTLIAYTDGLVERRGETLDVGMQRLQDVVTRDNSSLEDLLSSIVTELTGDSPTDDIALIGLRWLN
jgi:serine phosphatase RsbU (regulator of sigma subunit)